MRDRVGAKRGFADNSAFTLFDNSITVKSLVAMLKFSSNLSFDVLLEGYSLLVCLLMRASEIASEASSRFASLEEVIKIGRLSKSIVIS